MADVMVAQIGRQPVNAAKPADAVRDRLRARAIDTARIGKRGPDALVGKGARKGAGFGRAAKNKEIGTHV